MDEGVEGIRAARTERTGIYGHEGDVLGCWEGRLGGGVRDEGRLNREMLGETAPRSGQHGVGMIGGGLLRAGCGERKGLRAYARSTQQRLFSGGILGGYEGLLG